MNRFSPDFSRLSALFAAVALTVFATSAPAQEHPNMDLQNFSPALGPHSVFSTDTAGTLGHLNPAGQVIFDYNHESLVRTTPGIPGTIGVVDDQFRADLAGGIGFLERGQVAVNLPIYLVNNVELQGTDYSTATAGDLAIEPKYRFFETGPLRLAGALDFTFPTGRGKAFVGSKSITAQPKVIADASFGPATVAANLGAQFQHVDEFGGIDFGHDLTYKLGGKVEILEDFLSVGGEFYGATPFEAFFADSKESPIEFLLGADADLGPVTVTAGAGSGLNVGIGAPEFRAFAGVRYTGELSGGGDDPDGDGVANDQCPNKAEDFDDFQDDDGCPDPDNDKDGFADSNDACPNKAGPESDDGCPTEGGEDEGMEKTEKKEKDSDGDGLVDSEDECPQKAEDGDGFEDGDGCPDPDNDGDGIPDEEDECPMEAGVEANNGCPAEETEVEGATIKEDRVEFEGRVQFESGASDIKEDSHEVLASVAELLRKNPKLKTIQVQGHTDDVGEDVDNQKLSEKRANAVLDYLVQEEGIDESRLQAKGFGESDPETSNETEAGRAENRRVVFKIMDEKD